MRNIKDKLDFIDMIRIWRDIPICDAISIYYFHEHESPKLNMDYE